MSIIHNVPGYPVRPTDKELAEALAGVMNLFTEFASVVLVDKDERQPWYERDELQAAGLILDAWKSGDSASLNDLVLDTIDGRYVSALMIWHAGRSMPEGNTFLASLLTPSNRQISGGTIWSHVRTVREALERAAVMAAKYRRQITAEGRSPEE